MKVKFVEDREITMFYIQVYNNSAEYVPFYNTCNQSCEIPINNPRTEHAHVFDL